MAQNTKDRLYVYIVDEDEDWLMPTYRKLIHIFHINTKACVAYLKDTCLAFSSSAAFYVSFYEVGQ